MDIVTQLLVLSAGAFNVAFAAFHAAFPRLYHWDLDLRGATRRSQAIVHILNICLIFVLLLFTFLCAAHARELVGTRLGRTVLVGVGLFWCLRAALQAMSFGWRVRPTYTWGLLFLAGAALHIVPALMGTR